MTGFRDPTAANTTLRRLQALTDLDLGPLWASAFEGCPDPDAALANLERWVSATSNPGTNLEHLASLPRLATLLLGLLGSSQPLSDALIQNPELASLITDPEALAQRPTRTGIEREGRALLTQAESHAYRRDRLRYLKQRWMLPVAVNDLAGLWPPEDVWRALSDLADALLALGVETTWAAFAAEKPVPKECPVMVAALGKLGGRELNYSSDIDLAYVMVDDLDEDVEKHVVRFCEHLGRAMSERMGRGSLYRVDLRLRPYGGAGPIVLSMRSVEAYYNLHAEVWEVQALIRSRAVVAPPGLAERWAAMVERVSFGHRLSEFALDEILRTRERIEEMADDADLKRGRGGIRDIEFLTQVLQLVYGHADASVRTAPTCDALRALATAGRIDGANAQVLIGAYTFLRQLEHRCQIVGDQQTHLVPSQPEARQHLARMMRLADWDALAAALSEHRQAVRKLYGAILRPVESTPSPRTWVLGTLGPLRDRAAGWIDALQESDAFYRGLSENEGSLGRVHRLLEGAPTLGSALARSTALTERVLSGEIEELDDVVARIDALSREIPLDEAAKAMRAARTTLAARWALGSGEDLGVRLAALWDACVRHCRARIYAEFDVVAAGSYALGDCSIGSDLDLVFVAPEGVAQAQAEEQAQQLLAMFGRLRRLEAFPEVDLRLRPEGRQGLLVRTYAGLRVYELERMEMWERFALGYVRRVAGTEESRMLLSRIAYAMPLTPPRLQELVAMKQRIETERVMPHKSRRNVKLGYGGLSDIEWFVHLHEMRYPTALRVGGEVRMGDRLRALGSAGLINAVELAELLEARTHLLELRNRLALLGIADDLVPENPDKLDTLARTMGHADGNRFLAAHGRVIERVRTIYEEGLGRLGS